MIIIFILMTWNRLHILTYTSYIGGFLILVVLPEQEDFWFTSQKRCPPKWERSLFFGTQSHPSSKQQHTFFSAVKIHTEPFLMLCTTAELAETAETKIWHLSLKHLKGQTRWELWTCWQPHHHQCHPCQYLKAIILFLILLTRRFSIFLVPWAPSNLASAGVPPIGTSGETPPRPGGGIPAFLSAIHCLLLFPLFFLALLCQTCWEVT